MFEEYNKNGAVKTSITYRRGKLHGPSRLYTPGNHLISYTEYVNGKREGPAFSYYDNEQPKVLAYRKNDKLDGTAKEFNRRGELVRVVTYKDGEEIKSVKF